MWTDLHGLHKAKMAKLIFHARKVKQLLVSFSHPPNPHLHPLLRPVVQIHPANLVHQEAAILNPVKPANRKA